jgi:TolB-like protein
MLAVLPFANLSGQPDQDYFSDGLTEEMLGQLGRLHPARLGVIARTSVMRYKGTHEPIDRIGRELGVDYVLEGSVRRGPERVRITAQLIQVSDQTHLWTDCYERDLGDVLVLQSEIARAIAAEIEVKVTPAASRRLARAGRVDTEAHEAYLKGRFHWCKFSREHLDMALDYFQLAVDRDPSYALAHVGISYVWISRADCGFMPPRLAFPKAKAAASRANELDETLAEGHELLGNVRRHLEWDWNGAETEFRQAIRLEPNHAFGHFMYSDFLVSMRRSAEAMAEMRRALELDPLNFLFHCFLGWHQVYLGEYDAAIAQLGRTLRSEPNFTAAHLGLWGAFYRTRRLDEALAEARRFFELLGDAELAETLGRGYAEAGYAGAMHLAAEELAARSERTHVPALRIARLHAHAGESERALDWLEKACEDRETPLVHVRVSWDWDDVRDHPRFQELLRRMNLPQ